MRIGRIMLVLCIIAIIVSLYYLDVGQYLNLDTIKSQQSALQAYTQNAPVQAAAIFFIVYVLFTGFSIPGAVFLTILSGAIFGLWAGTLLVSFASSMGATISFLVARFLLHDWVQQRFGKNLKAINEGVKKDGAFYLFTLRLVPIFPFFVINLVMALTPIRTWTFYWVSQVGMLAATLVYVNAGTQLARLESLQGILSPELLGSFVLLGIFPLIAKKTADFIKARQRLWRYKRPKQFDRNIIVIGAGSAGLVTAYIAAAVQAKVTLIEKQHMGGDCLNTGCVPSKALIRSAKLLSQAHRAAAFGLHHVTVNYQFADIMERVQRVIKTVAPHDSIARYTALGVECIQGEAKITSPYTVMVNQQTLTTRRIVIATGARPFVPPIAGLAETGYLTSDTIWNLRELPQRLVILGGGPIGCELAQAFARLGSQVTQVERNPRLMMREDPDVAAWITRRFLDEGITVLTEHQAQSVHTAQGEKFLLCEYAGEKVQIPFDQILVAVGRVANTQGFGLEELGIPLTLNGTIEVNPYLQTIYPNIYAVGDVVGPYQFTHVSAHQAWYAAVNALFGNFKKYRVDYSVIPWATFTDPEVARVGLNEQEALQKGIPYEVTRFDIDELDRAITDEAAHGFVKVLTVPGKDKILGVTMISEQAGDLIAEYVLAMRYGIGLNKILGTIHIYPTWAEANKYAAGAWKRAHVSQRTLRWLEWFHRWQRG